MISHHLFFLCPLGNIKQIFLRRLDEIEGVINTHNWHNYHLYKSDSIRCRRRNEMENHTSKAIIAIEESKTLALSVKMQNVFARSTTL